MRDFSKNRRGKSQEFLRLVASVLGVVILLLLFVVSARAAWDMYHKFAQASDDRQTAERELGSLKEKEMRIQTAVAALSSERGVEQEIRARFGVVKPGEGEIQIVRDKDNAGLLGGEPQNIWERILQALSFW